MNYNETLQKAKDSGLWFFHFSTGLQMRKGEYVASIEDMDLIRSLPYEERENKANELYETWLSTQQNR